MNSYHSAFKESINKPIIFIPWNELSPTPAAFKFIEIFENYGASVKKLNYQDPDINCLTLKSEVDAIMDVYKNKTKEILKTKSIAYCILKIAKKGDYPEIGKIIKKVKKAMKDVQALLLPGGNDVPPFFYGQELEPKTNHTVDYRRDIFEFAMLNIVDDKGIPVLGICRGLQLANVWYGGSLTQHIDAHSYVIQKFSPIENLNESCPKSVIGKVFEEANHTIVGYSIHHQAVESLGVNLNVISKYQDGTIKALEGDGQRFLVLLQWHPERVAFDSTVEDLTISKELSKENYLFFKYFVDAAKTSHSH